MNQTTSCGYRRHFWRLPAMLGLLANLMPAVGSAALPVDEVVAAYFGPHLIEQGAANLTLDEAYRFQQRYVQVMETRLGPRRGFKVAMTSLSSQQHFGLSEPLYGQFLEKMLLQSAARLPLNFGARGLIEADLLVRVGDRGINSVTTIDDLLTHLDAVIPFIELPDPLWSAPLTAVRLVAVNCGARYGVLGEAIMLSGKSGWNQRFEEFEVELFDPNGVALASGRGRDLLGHPLNVVFWLLQRLRDEGIMLQPGDLLSLGSLTRPISPVAGRYQAIYRGLSPSGPTTVSVEFTPVKSALTE